MKNDWVREFWSIYTGKGSLLLAQAIFEPSLFPYKYTNVIKPSHSTYLSAYDDGTECSETSAYKIQTPGNYPEESIQHSENGESGKSRTLGLPDGRKYCVDRLCEHHI